MIPHLDRVRDLGCCICGHEAQAHHVRGGSIADIGIHAGMGQKNSDWLTIPLCLYHHTGGAGIHTVGVRGWEAAYGLQTTHVDATAKALGLDLWELSKKRQAVRGYKRHSKILPRSVVA